MPFNRKNIFIQSLAGILIVCLVSAISYFFTPITGYITVALILLVTVSLTAILFQTIPVLIAAIASAFIWDYFFIPPRFTLHVDSPEDALILTMYFVIVLVNAVLTTQIRKMERIARIKEEKANTIKLYNTLLNALSHELKTPIRTIIAAADNLSSNTETFISPNSTLLTEISTAADKLSKQVENLLNMSRIESGFIKPKLDWCDINELVKSSIHNYEDKLTRHKLKINIPQDLPLFKLDFGLMQQVLSNLLHNSILYTPAGSVISISAEHSEAISGHFSEDVESVFLDRKIDFLLFTFSDNGPGFSPEKIDKAFDKFYRIDHSVTGGTGLGLFIARGFVEAHYGKIKLSNSKNGGALFTIEIPAEIYYVNQQKINNIES